MPDLTPLKFQVAIQDEATRKLQEIENKFNELKDKTIKVKIEGVGDLQNLLSALQHKQVENLGKDVASGIDDAARGLQEKAQNAVRASLGKLAEDLVAVKTAIQHDNFTAFSTRIEKCAESVDKLNAAFEKFQVTVGRDEGMKNFMTGLGEVIRNVRSTMATLEAGKNGGFSGITNVAKQSQKETDQWAESMRRAGIEATKLEIQIRKLKEIEARGSAVGVDTSKLQNEISKLEELYGILMKISEGSRAFGHTTDLMKQGIYQSAAIRAKDEAKEVAKNTAEKERNSNATQQLSNEEQRLAQALQRTTESARSQSQVLSDLKSMAMQYLGVWGGQQFIHNIIEIGGQLEMQRLSIGAILQDTAHANELFEKIKGLATQSPFGVVQLDQMTKQLTAYGFKYNELYDMTKRLADISAATGTDVSRLALALGHVRSEAALSGYTLRQFSMANVPLLSKLSEKLGKTTKEIRDMVKKKEVGYDDVVGVLKDLTNEGGMFYNMQEVISESVKAKFKNVKDAMDIMYGEMAEGAPGDVLKKVAEVLMDVTRNWKDAATVIGTGAAVWATHRAAVLAMNAALGSNTASVTANMMAYKKKRAAELQSEAMTRKLTADELALIATRNKITAANIRVALSTNAITKGEALRLVGLRKLSLEEAKALIRSGEFTAAEVRMALQGRVLGMNLGFAGNMMKSFAASAKLAITALLSNPWTWAIAGITAMVELWQRNNQELERSKELSDDIYNRSQEGLKNTRTMMQNTGIRVDWRNSKKDQWKDVTGTFGQQTDGIMRFVKPSFDKNHDIEGTMEAWQQYIRDYAATPNRILNDTMTYQVSEKGKDGIESVTTKVRELRDQYDLLYESVINVSRAQQQMQHTGDAIEFAVNETNKGWLDDDLLTNIGDYDSQVKKLTQNIGKTYGDLRKYIDETVRKAQKEDKKFAEATKGMDNYSQAFAFLVKNHEKFSKADEIFKDAYFGVSSAYEGLLDGGLFDGGTMSGLENARKTMEEDLNTFFTSLENQLRNQKGWNIDEVLAGKMTLSEDKQQALLSSWKDALSKVRGLTDETAHELTQKFAERYRITIDADTENAIVKLAQLEQTLNNLVNGDYKVNVEAMTNSEAVFDKLKKDYKAAKSYIETSKPILAKFGISFTGKVLSKEQIDKALSNIPDKNIRDAVAKIFEGFNQAMGQLGKTQEAANNIGLKLEDDKKKKKTGKSKKTGGTKAYKDEFAKRWDERIRIMKEAYDWYDKWEKKVGNDSAIAETNSKYSDIFKEWRTDKVLPMDFDVKQIADYTKYVEKIRDDALKRYQEQKNDKGKNNGQEALRVYRQAVSLLNDVKFDNFAKAAEEFKSVIDQTITDLNERWDMFNTVRSATGNVALASRVAGIDRADGGARNTAAAMMNNLKKSIIDIGGDDMLQKVVFSTSMDDERIRNMFEEIVPDGAKEKIDGLIKSFKEWQKLQKQLEKEDLQVFASLIGSAVDLQSEVVKINDEYNKAIESLDRLKNSGQIDQSQHTRGVQIATANRNTKLVEATAAYKLLVDGVVTMSKKAAQKIKSDYVEALKAQLKAGAITAKDYANKIKDINQKMRDLEKPQGDALAYMKGGLNGLFENMIKRGESMQEEGAQIYQDAQDAYNTAQTANQMGKAMQDSKAGKAMMQMGEGMSKFGGEAMQTVAIIDMIVHGINDLVQGLKGTFDEIREMYDALGHDTKTDSWEDWNTFWSSFSAASDSATKGWDSLKNGNVGGVIEGVVGSFTGWITGFAKGHDQKLQNHIEKIQKNIDALDANTESIKSARERTLGFDFGKLRDEMSKEYNDTTTRQDFLSRFTGRDIYIDDEAKIAMKEYYSKNSNMSGYAAELANLKEQREDYLKMYNLEKGKKNESQDALDEYQKKIAELDEQIRYFSQDLAKELFEIDIKGWADKLSDALSSAFENGENMAKAYKETVTSILQDVMNKMMQMSILEPMFQNLQDKLFGNANKNIKGVFDVDDPKGSLGKVTAVISEYFGNGGEGEKAITAATEFMTAFQRGVQNSGLSVLNESSNTLSSGIQGTSEETSDLLAGYVNALRQDVSVNRILFTQFVTQLWPEYIEAFASHVRTVSNINTNVNAMVEMMRDGRGAIFDEIHSLRSRIDNVVNGNESFAMK